ncbi:MAG: hypothetical protein JWR18_2329 [Segetibacter sp.]|nr:hypothetical protein [Segetibacter sp.]
MHMHTMYRCATQQCDIRITEAGNQKNSNNLIKDIKQKGHERNLFNALLYCVVFDSLR